MYTQIFKLHSQLLKALSNPRRLEIIHLLRDGQLSVSQIHKMLDLPQANVSQHLMVLRKSGVVNYRKEGKQVFYSISHKNFIQASDLMRELLVEKHKGSHLEDEFLIDMNQLTPISHDPVCKMRVSPKTAGFATIYNGKKYYFCASGCKKEFKKQPKKYQVIRNNE